MRLLWDVTPFSLVGGYQYAVSVFSGEGSFETSVLICRLHGVISHKCAASGVLQCTEHGLCCGLTTPGSATALSFLPKVPNLETTLTPGTAPCLRRLACRRSSPSSHLNLVVRNTCQCHFACGTCRSNNDKTAGVGSHFYSWVVLLERRGGMEIFLIRQQFDGGGGEGVGG